MTLGAPIAISSMNLNRDDVEWFNSFYWRTCKNMWRPGALVIGRMHGQLFPVPGGPEIHNETDLPFYAEVFKNKATGQIWVDITNIKTSAKSELVRPQSYAQPEVQVQ
jgi:hypothetical protein